MRRKGIRDNGKLRIAILYLAVVMIAALIAGCSADQRTSSDFMPQYIGGYPTEETAKAAFDEYDYQAACQFYIWGYACLNSLGYEKGLLRLGGDERTIFLFDKRIQPQQGLLTPNDEVVYFLTQILHLIREKSKPSSFNQGLTVSN